MQTARPRPLQLKSLCSCHTSFPELPSGLLPSATFYERMPKQVSGQPLVSRVCFVASVSCCCRLRHYAVQSRQRCAAGEHHVGSVKSLGPSCTHSLGHPAWSHRNRAPSVILAQPSARHVHHHDHDRHKHCCLQHQSHPVTPTWRRRHHTPHPALDSASGGGAGVSPQH